MKLLFISKTDLDGQREKVGGKDEQKESQREREARLLKQNNMAHGRRILHGFIALIL